MADFVNYWAAEIIKHIPTVTWVGLSSALILAAVYFGKRWREAGLLACVCVAYGLCPYIPRF